MLWKVVWIMFSVNVKMRLRRVGNNFSVTPVILHKHGFLVTYGDKLH